LRVKKIEFSWKGAPELFLVRAQINHSTALLMMESYWNLLEF